jgi:hypothetical protein
MNNRVRVGVSHTYTRAETLQELIRFINDENRKFVDEFQRIKDNTYQVLHKEPTRPQIGQVIYADGNNFNPDSTNGEGLYIYKSDLKWHFIA